MLEAAAREVLLGVAERHADAGDVSHVGELECGTQREVRRNAELDNSRMPVATSTKGRIDPDMLMTRITRVAPISPYALAWWHATSPGDATSTSEK
jgi:hypothetical protein